MQTALPKPDEVSSVLNLAFWIHENLPDEAPTFDAAVERARKVWVSLSVLPLSAPRPAAVPGDSAAQAPGPLPPSGPSAP